MRVPVRWLAELVDLPEGKSTADLHAALVSVGFEEEGVHTLGVFGPIVVGRVLRREPELQSNGKTMNWCTVDIGQEKSRGIVCGAHNFDVGDLVVVALPGASLPSSLSIAERSTYGHVSDGMIMSASELGLGREEAGILRFADYNMEPDVGTDVVKFLGLDDSAIEINVTPDRGYALSLRGVAREYAHATGAVFADPVLTVAPLTGKGFSVAIDDMDPVRGNVGAHTFVTRVVCGVDATRPTPLWMVTRLALVGVRSISLPVDITNYVMFELGQPLHGYDLSLLEGSLTVRRAALGETLVTLDDETRLLDPEDLVIADEAGVVGLAGVMGGRRAEVRAGTTDILIEAAGFDQVSIARTTRRHKLWSEASRRFERGVDPLVAAAAADRAVGLLVELAGGTVSSLGSTLVDDRPRESISLPLDRPAAITGVEYTDIEVIDTLRALGAAVDVEGRLLTVTPPSWRPDIVDDVSLVEEVARIVGYERIPSILPVAPPGRGLTVRQKVTRRVAAALAANGLVEIVSAPFVSAATQAAFPGIDPMGGPSVTLANPLDAHLNLLRRSGLPALIEAARRNMSRGLVDVALFETARVFLPTPDVLLGTASIAPGGARPSDQILANMNASLPAQPNHVSVLLAGCRTVKQPGIPAEPFSVADALDIARLVAWAAGAQLEIKQTSHQSLHPGRAAALSVVRADGTLVPVGVAGELLPSFIDQADLPRATAILEIDLDELIASTAHAIVPKAIVAYPAATQDLSLVVGVEVPAGDVLTAVRAGAGSLLEDARLVDDYRGAGVGKGMKSLTFAMRFRASDRTLTAAETTKARDGAVHCAGDRYRAILRQ